MRNKGVFINRSNITNILIIYGPTNHPKGPKRTQKDPKVTKRTQKDPSKTLQFEIQPLWVPFFGGLFWVLLGDFGWFWVLVGPFGTFWVIRRTPTFSMWITLV